MLEAKHFKLHPLLSLEPIPGAGLGYRVRNGRIHKGEILLTEKSWCAGPLSDASDDDAMVSQYLERQSDTESSSAYRDALSISALTTADGTPWQNREALRGPLRVFGCSKFWTTTCTSAVASRCILLSL